MLRKFFFIVIYATIQVCSNAQHYSKDTFGNIKLKDFNPTSVILTNEDAAVILFDIGRTELVGNNNGSFDLYFKQHKKILIKKSSAFHLATIEEKLFNGKVEFKEKMQDIKAATYNVINGNIITTPLDISNDLIKEKLNDVAQVKKFTMPDVREGCIIEIEYVIRKKKDFLISPWVFQDKYPTLWSECSVVCPPIINFLHQRRGLGEKFDIDTSYTIDKKFNSIYFNGVTIKEDKATLYVFARKDIPAFKYENYTSSLKNYLSSIEFHLSSIKVSSLFTENTIGSWSSTAYSLLTSPIFGDVFEVGKNLWIEDSAKAIIGNSQNEEAAKKVYTFFQKHFNCITSSGKYFTKTPTKIWEEKTGTVGDINLLLTAFLDRLNFQSIPVILSTKAHGKPLEGKAILQQYNYVITSLTINGKEILLDASNKFLGFGQIPSKCFNGLGIKICKSPYLIPLNPDSVTESKTTSIFIVNSEKKGKLEASFTTYLGIYSSATEREKYSKEGKENYFKKLEKAHPFAIKITNKEVESEAELTENFTIKYDFETELGNEDIIYFTPLFGEGVKENPFKSTTRIYPVELDYCIDEIIVLEVEIPNGYVVDEMPKSTRVKLNEDEGMFEYIISKQDNKITLRSRIAILKATFLPEDYNTFRDFWAMIVKKHAEQIVFKKAK